VVTKVWDVKSWLGVLAFAALLGCGNASLGEPIAASNRNASREQPAASVADMPLMAASIDAAWRALPLMRGFQYRSFTSHGPEDRGVPGLADRGNQDFNNFLAVCGGRPAVRHQTVAGARCDQQLEGYLIAADDDAGIVTRIFFPATEGGAGFGRERIRIYLDDLNTPAFDGLLQDWRNGSRDAPPLTRWTSGALVIHAPLVYRSKLRILLDGLQPQRLYYYHVDVQRGSADELRPVHEIAEEFASLQVRVQGAEDASEQHIGTWRLEPGSEVTLLEQRGPATLQQLQFELEPAAPLRDLMLRILWEDAPEPAADLSLAAFFGCEDELASFETLTLAVRAGETAVRLVSSWPMPFFERARVQLLNASDRAVSVDTRIALSQEAPPEQAGHFHALRSRTQAPFKSGQRHPVISRRGRGKFVGTLMRMHGQVDSESEAQLPLAFLEGDDRFEVDGEVVARGTGTEDYFDGGWYFRDGPYDSPFSAAISLASDGDAGTGRATMARWHVLSGAIEFRESLEVSFEYGADRPKSAAEYDSVALFYVAER